MADFIKHIITLIKSIFSSKEQNTHQEIPQDGGDFDSAADTQSKPETEAEIHDDSDDSTLVTVEEKTNDNENMKNYSMIEVHLDGGHASSTPGKKSPYALYGIKPELDFKEYLFNREMVGMIEEKLLELGFKVHIVTPELDKDVKLTIRAKRANEEAAKHPELKHLFISVHANAHGDGTAWTNAKGWSCFTTKGQNNSDVFAECLYDAAREILPPLGITIRTDKSDGDSDWESNFTVIYAAAMPAILTENLFYTNVGDTEFLMSQKGKEAIRDIHVNGIIKYVKKRWGI